MATKIYAPVCASDGKTYSNKMVMENTGCEKNMVLTVMKRGKCKWNVYLIIFTFFVTNTRILVGFGYILSR